MHWMNVHYRFTEARDAGQGGGKNAEENCSRSFASRDQCHTKPQLSCHLARPFSNFGGALIGHRAYQIRERRVSLLKEIVV